MWYKCKVLIVGRYEPGLAFLCIWLFNLLGGKINLDNTFYFIKYLLTVDILRLTAALAFWAPNYYTRNTCSQFQIQFLFLSN